MARTRVVIHDRSSEVSRSLGVRTAEGELVTWYEHARDYTEAGWAGLATVSRRSVG